MLGLMSFVFADLPHVTPTKSPADPTLVKFLGVLMDALVIFLLAVIFVAAVKAVQEIKSRREGGVQSSVIQILAAIFVIGILLSGTQWLDPWVNFFTG